MTLLTAISLLKPAACTAALLWRAEGGGGGQDTSSVPSRMHTQSLGELGPVYNAYF